MVKLFGFEIRKSEEEKETIKSFSEPLTTDGALTIGGDVVGGAYGLLFDLEGSIKSEAELITRYRQMMNNPEIQQAVDEIVNEVISVDSHEKVVNVILDDVKLPNKTKKDITTEFDFILKMLDFSNNSYEIASRFYVDGRLNFHVLIDENKLSDGIKELRYLDPRKIKLIREMEGQKPGALGTVDAYNKKVKNEYYIYSENGFGTDPSAGFSSTVAGLKIAKDSIIRVTSGIMNESNTMVLSHLSQAYKPLNQLRTLEDSTVIYTLTRAPERRIFYVDVGNLPKAKAEQYLYDMMARHKNKVAYDPSTGMINDSRKMMTMTEDYWFPRREGNRSTEVETLPAGQGLGQNENIQYFLNKLYKSLNVPIARLQPETMYAFGRTNEVTREELKFAKFIRRIRTKLSVLFDEALKRQLILKQILTLEEWNEIKDSIRYDFSKDNYFEELKEMELLREKIGMLRDIEENIGKYYSRQWVKKNVLRFTDEQIDEMQKEIDDETSSEMPIDGQQVDGQGNPEQAPPQQQAAAPQNELNEIFSNYRKRIKK